MMEEFGEEDDNFDLSNLPPYYANKLNGFLREACRQGHVACVDVLVSRGADVNHIDKQDKITVLQEAILHGRTQILEYLYGKANEITRQSALAYATERSKKLDEILKILQPGRSTSDDVAVKSEFKEVVSSKEVVNDNHSEPRFEITLKEDTLSVSAQSPPTEDKKYSELRKNYDTLQNNSYELQKHFETYKAETEDLLGQLNTQVERLNNELTEEKKINQENEDVIDSLGVELSVKWREIKTVAKREREKRAKEASNSDLTTLATTNPPGVSVSPPPGQSRTADIAEKPRNSSLSNSSESLTKPKTTPQSTTTPPMPTPSKSKKIGSKDDVAIRLEDRVKDRVRRLINRWEEMAELDTPTK